MLTPSFGRLRAWLGGGFFPSPIAKREHRNFSYSIVSGALSSRLIARLRKLEEAHVLESAPVGTVREKLDRNLRDTSVTYLDRKATRKLYARLAISIEFARRELKLIAPEFEEPVRYFRYEVGGHFGCHLDHFKRIPSWLPVRKLSFTVPLSRPDEYDGGDLELFFGLEPIKIPQEPGSLIVFPSSVLHRVKPVTRGVRRGIVGWMLGPASTQFDD